MRYITRDFGDASFVFDTGSGNSLFFEGTLASQALQLINGGNRVLTGAFLSRFNSEEHQQIQQDWEVIQKNLKNFLKNDAPTSNNDVAGLSEKSAFEELSGYAIRNWQLVNVNLELTTHCNQHCRCCYLEELQLKGLSRSRLVRLADELRAERTCCSFCLLAGRFFLEKTPWQL